MKAIESAPGLLHDAVRDLTDTQLDTPYRPDGWTVRQVVHHVPDSHINAYVRFRWALTEVHPTIKVYKEARWAELPDARQGPIDESLELLKAVHRRWVRLIRSLKPEDYSRTVVHPEDGIRSIDDFLAIYAWHGQHHVAHITRLRDRLNW